ncbi:MAG TPA: hypothetical protein VGH19_22915 [Verrucomicrobiae bacterium]
MNRFVKYLVTAAAGLLLLVAGLIGLIEWQRWRSLREVKQVVAQIAPGTPFTNVVQQLGKPVDVIADSLYMLLRGTRKEENFVGDKVLHMFLHRGPPFRWILIYTDKDSSRVVYADWTSM